MMRAAIERIARFDVCNQVSGKMYSQHSPIRAARPLGHAIAAGTRAFGKGWNSQIPSRLQPAASVCNSDRVRPETGLDRPCGQPGHSRGFVT
jgi:hypothetical protein